MLNVAVLSGGYSKESVVSVKSARTILDELPKSTYNAIEVRIEKERWYALINGQEFTIDRSDFTFRKEEEQVKFDCVFIMVHGTPGEDGRLQAYFDLLEIPYTTSSQFVAALTFNKWACNIVLKQLGFKCAESVLLRKGDSYEEADIITRLGLPCFVKPNDGGSSFGVTKVKEADQLGQAIQTAFSEGSEVIIEATLMGPEVTAGACRYDGKVHVLPVTQIISEGEYFDWAAKYEGASEEITPAPIDEELYKRTQAVTGDIYAKLGMKGIARVDYIIQNNEPFVIEVNTVPGMSKPSIVPQQIRADGSSMSEFLDRVVKEAIRPTI